MPHIDDAACAQNGSVEHSASYDAKTAPRESVKKWLGHEDSTTEYGTASAEMFWKEKLEGAQASTFPRSQRLFNAAGVTPAFNKRLSIPKIEGSLSIITQETLLRAACAIVLARYCDTQDITFGVSVSKRKGAVPETQDLHAPTLATLPFRVQFRLETKVEKFLQDVQNQTLDMTKFEPIGLQNIANVSPDAAEACKMRTLVVIRSKQLLLEQRAFDSIVSYDTVSNASVGEVGAPHDYPLVLSFSLYDNGSVDAHFSYDVNIMSLLEVEAIGEHLQFVLQQLVTKAAESLREISPIGPWDKSHAMKHNKLEEPTFSCIHWGFEKHVETQPDAPAVVSWDGRFTYKELHEHASRLAQKLQALGVGPEVIVPFCFHKSIWAVVTMMAIQIAGGGFVPLDSAAPPSRLRSILEDTKAKLILVGTTTYDSVKSLDIETIIIDSDYLSHLPPTLSDKIVSGVQPHNVSFIIFTSGSTGKPKGVVIEHTTISSCADGYACDLAVGPGTRVFAYSTYTFDAGINDVLVTLSRGACVCVPSEDQRRSDISGAINRLGANWAVLTPTVASLVDPSKVHTLKKLAIGGEVITKKVVDMWHDSVDLHGIYGPAEVSICAWRPALSSGSPNNIGTPIRSAFWVVDQQDATQLVPVGCIGELVIQGPILARGYIGATEKENAAWLHNTEWVPDEKSKGKKAYRTGDLVRRNADGTFDFIGRRDTQVKLHGQRIELGEIENRLEQCLPPEMSIMVNVLKSESDHSILAALLWYTDGPESTKPVVQLADGINESMRSLISHLDSSLAKLVAPFMRPSIYLVFEGTPDKTSSGKTDRRKLHALAEASSSTQRVKFATGGGAYEEPATEIEFKLRDLWAEVLQVSSASISRNDSFIRLGGDSIAAMKLVSVAPKRSIYLTFSSVFNNSSLFEMAASVKDNISWPAGAPSKNAEYGLANLNGSGSHTCLEPFSLLDKGNTADLLRHIREVCSLSDDQNIEDAYPSTSLQEGLMSLSVQQPQSYIAQWVLQLKPEVSLERFRSAWDKTVKQCPILRTRLVQDPTGATIQAVLSNDSGWENGDGQTLSGFLTSVKENEMTYGSRLSRYGLVVDSNGARYFVWIGHHSIYDGWTMGLWKRIFKSSYSGTEAPKIEPLTTFIQYRQSLHAEDSAQYWKSQLNDAKPTLFPPRRQVRNASRAAEKVDVLRTRLAFNNAKNGSFTKATIIRAAWAIILARYCSKDDVCFASSISGRQAHLRNVESIPGPLVATVPVRIRLERQKFVHSLLRQVQNQAADMVPYEQFGLQNISKISNDIASACDFSSLLVVQPIESIMDTAEDEIFEKSEVNKERLLDELQGYFNYPLVVQVEVSQKANYLSLIYDTSVMDEVLITRLSRHFESVVSQINERLYSKLDKVSLTNDWDTSLAIQYNNEHTEIVSSTFHSLVDMQATQSPESCAIRAWDQKFTYRELVMAANRLAHHLVSEYGVKKGELVLVCFEKSAWYFVSILAINKAGAAWVPLDPSHPRTRQKQIADQTQARVALVSAANNPSHQSLVSRTIEVSHILDQRLRVDMGKRSQPPAVSVTPHDLIYMLFTSGSTGTPKGLMMEHQAVCTSQTAIARRLNLRPDVRMLQFASFVFDLSVGEIIGPLIMGASLCIPSDQDRTLGTTEFMKAKEVNWAYLTPTFARTLKPADFPDLKVLLLAGEAVSQDLLDMWLPHVKLYNGYGPAETCCFSTIHEWESTRESPLTVGRPVGSHCWIVEPSNSNTETLALMGVVGEIIIQGPTVLRGYLADAERSHASILENAPSWAPNQISPWNRYFKTGDLGSYNLDGTIEFVGRKDQQVKIRGLRIELSEVEHHVRRLLRGNNQVVVDVLSSSSTPRLCCFFTIRDQNSSDVGHSGSNFTIPLTDALIPELDDVAAGLRNVLPQYMVPSIFIHCGSIPMTTSTKVDRRRLREQAERLSEDDLLSFSLHTRAKQRPQSDLEMKILQIWADTLGLSNGLIGTNDNFFAIGGDSIRIISLSTSIEKQLNVKLGRFLLNGNNLTIRDIAKRIEHLESGDVGDELSSTVDLLEEIARMKEPLLEKPLEILRKNAFVEQSGASVVFLTGASGYLGSEILHQLVVSEDVKSIIALVRAASAECGLDKIRRAAERARWWDEKYVIKLEVWVGDLASQHLGLDEDQWDRLYGQSFTKTNVTAIVHNGATVNFNAGYNQLRPANVGSAVSLLKAAMLSSLNPRYIFISGGVKMSTRTNKAEVAKLLENSNGYAQTKFVAENIVNDIALLLPNQNRIGIVKPGRIIGNVEDGIANLDDYIWRVVAAAAALGVYPTGPDDVWVHMADVSTLSSLIMGRLHTTDSLESFDDVSIGLKVEDFWKVINEELDTPCRPVLWDEWINRCLAQTSKVGKTHPLWPIQTLLGAIGWPETPKELQHEVKSSVVESALRKNIHYMKGSGMIDMCLGTRRGLPEDAFIRSSITQR